MITSMTEDSTMLREAIYEHLEAFWPNSDISEEQWALGPIEKHVPGLKILRLISRQPGKPVIYVTLGCFSSEPAAHIKHEFFIISPRVERQHVETLTMLADFHADERYALDVGSVVNIGESWMSGSACSHLLLSVPFPYGPKLEWLTAHNRCVRFLWALPITEREAAFADLHGVQALEERFDAAKLNYLDENRQSVI